MQTLTIQAPPYLAETLGYDGPNRFVGFFWTPAGDEFCYDDGTVMTTNGVWHAWDLFQHHEYAMVPLAPFHFGNSEEDAKHWLIVDRETNTLHVAPAKEADRFLAEHAPAQPQLTGVSREEILKAFEKAVEDWKLIPAPSMAEIQAQMAAEAQRIETLAAWLDECVRTAKHRRCTCGLSVIDDGRPCLHFDFKTYTFLG